MTRRIIVWRHGRTAWNLAGRLQGQTDVPLDDVGREQARAAAARLATLRPTHIVTSDLSRARETADHLGRLTGVDVEVDARLRERRFGLREGLTVAEAWERFPEHMALWAAGEEAGIPGSESGAAAGQRFAEALTDHLAALESDQTLVVVAHGGVTRAGTLTFLDFPRSTWETFGGLSNCAWTVLEESDHGAGRRWRVTEWNAGTLPEPVLSDDEWG